MTVIEQNIIVGFNSGGATLQREEAGSPGVIPRPPESRREAEPSLCFVEIPVAQLGRKTKKKV